jgi:hypothetical protein
VWTQASLAGSDLRLARADKHLTALNEARASLLCHKDCRIVGYLDLDASEYVFRVNVAAPPFWWGLLLSEYAHHLRAALDNLVYALVRLRGGIPTKRTQFPIFECIRLYRDRAPSMLSGTSAEDRAFIQSMQPYQARDRPETDPLALLGWMNNTDKHRFLHAGFALIRTTPQSMLAAADRLRIVGLNDDVGPIAAIDWDGPFEDRTEIARVRLLRPADDPQMEMKGRYTIDVSLSDGKPLTVLHLQSIRSTVQQIIDRFRPAFS